MAGAGPLLAAALVETGIVTWRDVSGQQGHVVDGLPLPADYVAVVILYGALSFLADAGPGARTVANLVGWGYVVATLLTSGSGPLAALSGAVQKSGSTSTSPATTGTGTTKGTVV